MKLRNVFFVGIFLFSVGLTYSQAVLSQDAVPSSRPSGQAPLTTTSENPQLTAALQGALELFKKTDFNGALEQLKPIYAAQPQIAPPRIVLAQWFARAGIQEGVQASLDMATVETPEDPEAYLLLGELSLRQRERAAASLFLERANYYLQRYNANPERKKQMQIALFRNLTGLAELLENWENMERMIDQRIAIEGRTSELLRQKAVAAFRLKKDQESATLLAEADRLDANKENKPLPAEAIMSQLYQQRGDKANTQSSLAAALSKHPKNPDVLALSASSRVAVNDLSGARQLAERILVDHPNAKGAKGLVASIALMQGDYPTAEKFFQELVVASPSDAQSTNGLALALAEQNDPAKLRRALEYAAENVKKNNRNSEFLGTLGWLLMKAGDMKQAGQVLQQAAAHGNVSSQTAFFLAKFVSSQGNYAQAKQLLEAAMKSERPFAKMQEAKQLLEEVSKQAPASTSTTGAQSTPAPTTAQPGAATSQPARNNSQRSAPRR